MDILQFDGHSSVLHINGMKIYTSAIFTLIFVPVEFVTSTKNNNNKTKQNKQTNKQTKKLATDVLFVCVSVTVVQSFRQFDGHSSVLLA